MMYDTSTVLSFSVLSVGPYKAPIVDITGPTRWLLNIWIVRKSSSFDTQEHIEDNMARYD